MYYLKSLLLPKQYKIEIHFLFIEFFKDIGKPKNYSYLNFFKIKLINKFY